MPHRIDFVTDASQSAHYEMLDVIRATCLAAGWAVLRYDTSKPDRELILKAPGVSGAEEIFVGIRTYQNANADYYNFAAAGFTGYLPNAPFDNQPGVALSGVPAHNRRIDYWLTVNKQRLALCMKVGTPVYESLYLGKMLPYARPGQFPYPLLVGGMLDGAPATRFSETTHSMCFKGNRGNCKLRFNDGLWYAPQTWPWSNAFMLNLRDTENLWPVNKIVLHDAARGVLGELDGIYHITGFNLTVESTVNVDGEVLHVLQDVGRTGHADYFAMRMDT